MKRRIDGGIEQHVGSYGHRMESDWECNKLAERKMGAAESSKGILLPGLKGNSLPGRHKVAPAHRADSVNERLTNTDQSMVTLNQPQLSHSTTSESAGVATTWKEKIKREDFPQKVPDDIGFDSQEEYEEYIVPLMGREVIVSEERNEGARRSGYKNFMEYHCAMRIKN